MIEQEKFPGYAKSGLVVLLLLAFGIAVWDLKNPGLYYDEVLFANASAGGESDHFVTLRIGNIPVLLMDYLGAGKAWLYRPIFLWAPLNEWTLRIPSIFIGLSGGVLFVLAVGRMFGGQALLLAALLVLLDPSLITHSRLDWGPSALMFFFRGLLLYAVVGWLRTRKHQWVWLAVFALSGGVFDKLNFLWLGGAAFIALVVVYPDRILENLRSLKMKVIMAFLMLSVILVLAGWRAILLSPEYSGEVDWSLRKEQVAFLLALVWTGGGAVDFVAGSGMHLGFWVWPAWLVCVLLALPGIPQLIRHPYFRFWCFLFLWMMGSLLAFALTPGATGPHHAVLLSGMPQILLAVPMALSIPAAQEWKWPWWPKLAGGLLPVALLCFIQANIVGIWAFREPTNPNWDRANTEVALYIKEHIEDYFLFTDWGMATQAIALSRGQARVGDHWPSFFEVNSAMTLLDTLQPERVVYAVVRREGFETFPQTRINFFLALLDLEFPYERVAEFQNSRGIPMIEIYRIETKPTSKKMMSRPK